MTIAPWRKNSVYIPRSEMFHQHFSTEKEQGKLLKVEGKGTMPISPLTRKQNEDMDSLGQHISVRQGGTQIEFEDEDPEVRRMFEGALRKNGLSALCHQ